jgi:hypothetical protein
MSNDPFSQDLRNPTNPYAPTTQLTASSETIDPNQFDAYRRAHLSHEASVKSIGCLYYFGAVFGVLFGVIYIVSAVAGGMGNADVPVVLLVGIGAFMLGIGLAQGYVGYGLRRLLPWARIGGIVISAIGLLGFPIGTLISAYFLYLLVSQKGEIVFSDYYRHVIAQTPHIQYKTSIIVKVLLGLLVGVLLLGIVAAIVGG